MSTTGICVGRQGRARSGSVAGDSEAEELGMSMHVQAFKATLMLSMAVRRATAALDPLRGPAQLPAVPLLSLRDWARPARHADSVC